jgi:murein DD-endopeptidase MepM/ murein hydrolase activator NlpD
MRPRDASVELRIVAVAGREHRLRLGGWGGLLLVVTALTAIVALGFGVATVPAALSRSRDRRAMDTALQRRAQLGDRLRAFVEEYEQLDRQVRAHAARVDRIRGLFGLPELGPAPRRQSVPRRTPAGIFAGALLHAERLHLAIDGLLARTDLQLAVLAAWEEEHPELARAVPVRSPVRPTDAVPITGFGRQRHPVHGEPEFHAGIDLAVPAGASIRAPAAGRVRWAGDAPRSAGEVWWRLGRVVVIAHGTEYRTLFGHCDRILVRTGDRVAAGDVVALAGDSGWTPTPRLHYEVRRISGEGTWDPVDPALLSLDASWDGGRRQRGRVEPDAELVWSPLPRLFRR